MKDITFDLDLVTLEKMKVATSRMTSTSGIQDAKFRVIQHHAEQMCIELSGYVLAEKLDEQEAVLSVRVPATWWDHFKETHFDFLLRWFPVNYKYIKETHQFKLRAVYPKFIEAFPEKCENTVVFNTSVSKKW